MTSPPDRAEADRAEPDATVAARVGAGHAGCEEAVADTAPGGPRPGRGVPRAGLDAALDAALLAARSGDPAAQAAFVRASHTEVWRFVASLTGIDAADDVTQDTYLRVFRALPDFAGRSAARTWLLSIARRACADHVRTSVRQRRLEGAAARQPAADRAPDHADLLGAADLLRRLDPDRRSAFVLTQMLGLSYAEAAEAEGVPIGTIRSRVARARATLVEAVSAAVTS